MAGRLLVVEGPDRGTTYPLAKDDVLVGHHLLECDLYLADEAVARSHLRVFREDGNWYLRNVSEGDVVWVNDDEVEDACLLEDGDQIRLGESQLKFEEGKAAARSAPPGMAWVLAVGLLVLVGLAVYSASGNGGEPVETVTEVSVEDETPLIPWDNPDQYPRDWAPDKTKAEEAYERGMKFYEDRTVHLSNPYYAIIEFKAALALTEKLPEAEMPRFRFTLRDKLAELLDFLNGKKASLEHSIRWAEKTAWWAQMAENLRKYQALFPNKRTEEYQKAEKAMRWLRQTGKLR